jgi:hypothetical protein
MIKICLRKIARLACILELPSFTAFTMRDETFQAGAITIEKRAR